MLILPISEVWKSIIVGGSRIKKRRRKTLCNALIRQKLIKCNVKRKHYSRITDFTTNYPNPKYDGSSE